MIMTTTATTATSTTTTTATILIVSLMAGFFGCVSSTKTVDVCNRETQLLDCGRNDVIHIVSALNGRMSKGRCIASSNLTVTCSTDVTLYLDHKCAGRRQCSVSIDHTLDNSPHGCHPDLKIYLEIVYSCIPVVWPQTTCNGSPYVIHPTEPRGNLARLATIETGIGSSPCPWVIEVKSGQTLALTLLDFGIWRLANQSSDGRIMCQIYMTVTDRVGSGSPAKVCGGTKADERERKSFFTSNANRVQITVNNSPGDDQFLVKYEVLGCPDLSPTPPHSSVDRHGDNLTIQCEAGRGERGGRGGGGGLEPIVLTCVDGNWTGPALVNCSTLLASHKGLTPEGQSSSSGGVLMVVVVAAAVVVVILVATVAVVVLWRHRILKRRSEEVTGATVVPLTENYQNYQFVPTPGCFDPVAFPGSHYALTPATAGPTMPAPGHLRLLHDGSRRPSAELLQPQVLDYSTLQARRVHPGALPKNLGHSVSFSSFRQLPGTAAAAGEGGPYNGVNAMMVYCPYHGTITRVQHHGGHPHPHDPLGFPGGPGGFAGHHPLSHSHEDVMGRSDDDGDGNQFLQQSIYQELEPELLSPDSRC